MITILIKLQIGKEQLGVYEFCLNRIFTPPKSNVYLLFGFTEFFHE